MFPKCTTHALFSLELLLPTWFAHKNLPGKGPWWGRAALGGVRGVLEAGSPENAGSSRNTLGQRTSGLLLDTRLWEEKSMFDCDFKEIMFTYESH